MIKTNLITDFFKNINPAFSKYIHKEKPKIEVSADNPDIMPAYAHDYGNYVARYGMGNFMIQVMMKFDGRLDFDKLKKAVRLSVDQEPVLGCRFVEDDPPYWKRREDIDSIEFCTIEETDNIDEAVNRFLETTIDMDKDPMVKVKLIRSDKFDTLGIKINHTCSDGSGSKDYVNLLSHIYTCLDSGNGVFEPKPIERSRKDHEKIFETLGIEHPEQDNSMMDTPRTIWPFLWKSAGQKDITPFAISRLPEGQLDVLSKYAKERNATINDLVFTAFYRAMFKFTQPPYGIPMDVGMTVDLRRYLPDNKAEAIRNLSGGLVIRLARQHGESFDGTLSRVKALMNRVKNEKPGYQCATGAERAEMVSFHQFLAFSKFVSKLSDVFMQKSFFCSPGMSNVGIISKDPIKFGANVVTDAYILPPVIHMPGILFVASSYNGIMTIATGYYKGSVSKSHLQKLVDKVIDELVEGCK